MKENPIAGITIKNKGNRAIAIIILIALYIKLSIG